MKAFWMMRFSLGKGKVEVGRCCVCVMCSGFSGMRNYEIWSGWADSDGLFPRDPSISIENHVHFYG